LQLIDLPSIDWSQEIVFADVEAAECLRLIRVVATKVAMVGVAECDIVDAGIEAAHVATGTTVKKKYLGACVTSISRQCGNEEAEYDGLADDDREAALSCGYDWICETNDADIEADVFASESPLCDKSSSRDLLVSSEVHAVETDAEEVVTTLVNVANIVSTSTPSDSHADPISSPEIELRHPSASPCNNCATTSSTTSIVARPAATPTTISPATG
jgi:hypothetical protein